MSIRTFSLHAFIAALMKAEQDYLGTCTWRSDPKGPNQSLQDWILDITQRCRGDVGNLPIEAIAQLGGVDLVNEFFAQRKIDIRLAGPIGELDVSCGTLLTALGKWVVPGKKSTIIREQQPYPAGHVKDAVQVWQCDQFPNPVAQLRTKKDIVLLTVIPEPKNIVELWTAASGLKQLSTLQPKSTGHQGVTFPNLNLDHQPDISWALGINTVDKTRRNCVISQAKQQVQIQMNHLGFRVRDAVAVVMERMMVAIKNPLVIDQPYLGVWLRDSTAEPYMTGFFGTEAWSDPGDIEGLADAD
jgi:hypothetical protein